jgi:hypothetical protein
LFSRGQQLQLGGFADGNAPPQVELKQAILRGDEPLREKQVVFIPGVNVGNTPAVAQHLDGFFQSRKRNLAVNLGEDCLRTGEQRFGGNFLLAMTRLREAEEAQTEKKADEKSHVFFLF